MLQWPIGLEKLAAELGLVDTAALACPHLSPVNLSQCLELLLFVDRVVLIELSSGAASLCAHRQHTPTDAARGDESGKEAGVRGGLYRSRLPD